MATWEKIKFFYDTMLGEKGTVLSATGTLAGTDVANIYNMLEVNRWEAADAADPQYITWSADILFNGGFEAWTGGAPDYWALSGAGASVTAETVNVKEGTTSARVTRAGADAYISQTVTSFRDHLGEAFSLGVWVMASAPSQARLAITDGVRTTYSPWHSGAGGWEFLEAELVISKAATSLEVRLEVMNTNGDVFFDSASGGVRKSADYLAVLGHGFYSSSGLLILEASDDGFVSEVQGVISVRPGSDRAFVAEARLLVNGDFEVWDKGAGAAPAGWTLGGGAAATVGREALNVMTGLYSARLSSGLNETAYLEADHRQNPVSLSLISGKTVTFGAYVNAASAGRVTLRVYDDDGTGPQFTESAAHTGSGGWEFLSVTRTLRPGLTSFYVRCFVAPGASATAYIESAALKTGASLSAGDQSDYIAPGSVSRRHWRLRMTGHSSAPFMNICIWGDKTVLDYASASFDPYDETVQANLNISNTGYLMGVHKRYSERNMSLVFRSADASLYAKVRSWWEKSGLGNFFVAWERGNNPDDVFLMYPDKRFSNPVTNGGVFRDINIKLKGRKE